MTADLDLLRQLYRGPSIAETSERLAAQLAELSARPTADGCDHVIRSLSDASAAVSHMQTQLLSGNKPNA